MATEEEPVTAHQSWNWFHANPSIARRRLWAALSHASWLQPRGGHLPTGLVEAQPVPARRLPHSSRIVRERVARRSESPKLPTSKQTPSGNRSYSVREASWSLGPVFVSAVAALVLFTPKGKCGKYHNPTFSTQNNSTLKTILAIILNVHSDTTVLPGERLTFQKAGGVRGLVKKHSLIFHN